MSPPLPEPIAPSETQPAAGVPAHGHGQPPRPPRARGCLFWSTVLLALGLAGSVLFNLKLLAALGGATAGAGERPLAEQWVEGQGEERIALIEIEGVLLEDLGPSPLWSLAPRPVERLRAQLERAAEDPRVRAVVLRIDSPGGAVSTADQMWNLVRAFRERTGRPVVVSMGGMCTSGAYYVAAAADRLLAEPTTVTGSIGVILRSLNVAGLLQRLAIEPVVVASGANKDLLSPLVPVAPEHLEIAQRVIDAAYERFLEVVLQGRAAAGLERAQLRALADGRILTAQAAQQGRLVDAIGYREDAIAEARRLAGLERARVVRYVQPRGLLQVLLGARGKQPALSAQALLELARPRLLALWPQGG